MSTAARLPLARRLADAREAAGISQSETARRMVAAGHTNWTQMTVARSEQGKRPVGAVELLDLAAVLHADHDRLLARRPNDVYATGYAAGRRDGIAWCIGTLTQEATDAL